MPKKMSKLMATALSLEQKYLFGDYKAFVKKELKKEYGEGLATDEIMRDIEEMHERFLMQGCAETPNHRRYVKPRFY